MTNGQQTEPNAEGEGKLGSVSAPDSSQSTAPPVSQLPGGLAPAPDASKQMFLMGTFAGAAVVGLVGFGVLVGLSLSSSLSSDLTGPIQLTRDQEVLLVDPVTRAPARSALKRWGRIAPEGVGSEGPAQPQSALARQASDEANTLAGGGDAVAAAVLLEQARANATSDSERVALGFQQILMLNTAGQREQAMKVADDVGRDAKDFGTQRAALGALEGLEQGEHTAP